MKKLLSISLGILVLAFLVSGCKKKQEPPVQETQEEVTPIEVPAEAEEEPAGEVEAE